MRRKLPAHDSPERGGTVLFTSSTAASAGIPGLAPHSATKAALNQLARSLAVEWAPHDIRVNAVAPGYVENIMSGVAVHATRPSKDAPGRSRP